MHLDVRRIDDDKPWSNTGHPDEVRTVECQQLVDRMDMADGHETSIVDLFADDMLLKYQHCVRRDGMKCIRTVRQANQYAGVEQISHYS